MNESQLIEDQMIEDLRSALDDVTSHVGARPGLAERARAGGRRRRTVRGLLAGGPAVALAAGAVFAVHGSAPAATTAGTGVVMPASSSPGSVQLTSYQTAVLAKAHVTKADLAVLKKMHLTPLQIKILGEAYRTARQIAGPGGGDKQLTVAEIAAVVKVKPTIAELAAGGYTNMTADQIEAIAKADLTAAQLAAVGG
jgi:hypothetical protein